MQKSKLKVMTIVGTRPEIIRLSSTIKLLDKVLNHIFVHTGQNYDYELNDIFFNDLELRKPDIFMDVSKKSLGSTISDIIKKSELILKKEEPDALIILGDTNSCLSAYMAKRLHVPIYHLEAGNRCFDYNVPEETNRRIIDHIADFNLVYTEHSRRHLLSEGFPHRRIYLTGSPMKEVLSDNMDRINKSNVLKKLVLMKKDYFLVSVHREENVDDAINLRLIVTILNSIAQKYDIPVIVSTHPRTRNRLEKLEGLKIDKRVRYLKPFGFLDYNHLQMNSRCVISDSGTISEESAILNFPAVTIRNSMERPEALDTGNIVISGLNSEIVLDSIELNINKFRSTKYSIIPDEYKVNDFSYRVVGLVLGLTKLRNVWLGIHN